VTTEITRNVDEMILGRCERYKVTSVAISHDPYVDEQKAAGGHA